MSKVKVSFSVSIDGFGAAPQQSFENPMGVGGEALAEWAFATRTFQRMHGKEEGTSGIDDDFFARRFLNVGALIFGRNMFGPVRGAWRDDSWKGWWGGRPPFHNPVFVLTHYPRESIPMQGGTTFTFVTEGIEAALDQARKAAGEKDVTLAGGASIAQQYLKAGLVDELQIHVAPVFLGDGVRLFESLGDDRPDLEVTRVVDSPTVTHLRYRVQKGAST